MSGNGGAIGINRITMRGSQQPVPLLKIQRDQTHLLNPAEPNEKKRVHRGGSFLCTEQYFARYMIGTRGKGEIKTGSNHLGFRCVVGITPKKRLESLPCVQPLKASYLEK